MFRKFIAFLLLTFSFSSLATNDDAVSGFVDNLINDTFAILKDESLNLEQKIDEAEILIRNNMDLKWVSKFVLGRHRRSISKEQLSDFTDLYSEFIVKSYSNAIKEFKNQKIEVKKQKKINSTDFAVKTLLKAADADPIRIEYMIRAEDGSFKVFDVVTEGVSLINSHQAEFSSTISNENFEELMNDLRSKINSLNKKNKNDA